MFASCYRIDTSFGKDHGLPQHAHLPNPGRTTTHRRMTIGSNASVSQNTDYRCDDVPVGFTWYGCTKLAGLCQECGTSTYDVHLQRFGATVRWKFAEMMRQTFPMMSRDDLECAANAVEEAQGDASMPAVLGPSMPPISRESPARSGLEGNRQRREKAKENTRAQRGPASSPQVTNASRETRPVTAIGTGMTAIGTLVWVEQQVRKAGLELALIPITGARIFQWQ